MGVENCIEDLKPGGTPLVEEEASRALFGIPFGPGALLTLRPLMAS